MELLLNLVLGWGFVGALGWIIPMLRYGFDDSHPGRDLFMLVPAIILGPLALAIACFHVVRT